MFCDSVRMERRLKLIYLLEIVKQTSRHRTRCNLNIWLMIKLFQMLISNERTKLLSHNRVCALMFYTGLGSLKCFSTKIMIAFSIRVRSLGALHVNWLGLDIMYRCVLKYSTKLYFHQNLESPWFNTVFKSNNITIN